MIVGGLAAVLGVLGFACCYGPAVEYGVPYTSFKATGVVEDASGDAIQGISVKLIESDNLDNDQNQGVFTNSDGIYITEPLQGMSNILILRVEDIDGAENGSYENTDLTADYTSVTATGSSGWYQGLKTKTIDVTLNKK